MSGGRAGAGERRANFEGAATENARGTFSTWPPLWPLGEYGLAAAESIRIANQPGALVRPSPFEVHSAVPPEVAAFFEQDEQVEQAKAVLDEPCKPVPFGGRSFPSDESPDNSCAAAGSVPASSGLPGITQMSIGSWVLVEIRNATCHAGIRGGSGKVQLPTEWSQLAAAGAFVPEVHVPLWPTACALG